MLNFGLIGDIQQLEPYAKKAMEHPEVHITGKSSVGTRPQPGNFRLPAPEFNRIELIERSDVLLINRFSLLPFHLLCDMVKRSKHFLAIGYPDLSIEECSHLAKLSREAKTVIQVSNPYYFLPSIQWLNHSLKKPAYLEIAYFQNETPNKTDIIRLMLMLKKITGTQSKRTKAVTFRSDPANSNFTNLQLEYDNGSFVSFRLGKSEILTEFQIRSYARDQFTESNLINGASQCNNEPVDLSRLKIGDEIESFLEAVFQMNQNTTGIEDYLEALRTIETIRVKLDQYPF